MSDRTPAEKLRAKCPCLTNRAEGGLCADCAERMEIVDALDAARDALTGIIPQLWDIEDEPEAKAVYEALAMLNGEKTDG